MICYKTSNFK